jgi:hypothetical protein
VLRAGEARRDLLALAVLELGDLLRRELDRQIDRQRAAAQREYDREWEKAEAGFERTYREAFEAELPRGVRVTWK